MISIRETEHWALRVLNALDARTFGEDALVELKRDWPRDAYRAARRIAGHANAARGREVLWIIGVDEQAGIVGAEASDMASWMPQVWQHFERSTPSDGRCAS